jgi:hypothetical protein
MRLIACVAVLCCGVFTQAQQTPTSNPKQDTSNTAIPNAPSAVKPLTAGGKLKIAAFDAVHPLRIAGAAVSAGIAQASDPYPEWGDGGEGYAKRFGAAVADEASGHIFKRFLFPSLLRTDPRYFRKATGSAGARIGYAATRVFVTRTDSGHQTVNASEFLGAASSAALSTVYYPRSGSSTSDAISRAGLGVASDMGWNVFKEFWPDIWKKLRHR